MNPRNAVEKGKNSIFFSVTERTCVSSDSIDSIAFVLSFHWKFSLSASIYYSLRKANNNPFCAVGYLDSRFASIIIFSRSFSFIIKFCPGTTVDGSMLPTALLRDWRLLDC
jgi:hypothetical protein